MLRKRSRLTIFYEAIWAFIPCFFLISIYLIPYDLVQGDIVPFCWRCLTTYISHRKYQ